VPAAYSWGNRAHCRQRRRWRDLWGRQEPQGLGLAGEPAQVVAGVAHRVAGGGRLEGLEEAVEAGLPVGGLEDVGGTLLRADGPERPRQVAQARFHIFHAAAAQRLLGRYLVEQLRERYAGPFRAAGGGARHAFTWLICTA
jgi:hypothetical protein